MSVYYFQLTNESGFNDEPVYGSFSESAWHALPYTMAELVAYLIFKANEMYEHEVRLDNETVFRFLAMFGAQSCESLSDVAVIDVYQLHEQHKGMWYQTRFADIDEDLHAHAMIILVFEHRNSPIVGEGDG